MNLSEKIDKLNNTVKLLEFINSLCEDIKIINNNNLDYYCSHKINIESRDIEILEPSTLTGSYNCCLYKDYNIDNFEIERTLYYRLKDRNSKIRIYGFPLMISLFDINLNILSFSSYEKDLEMLSASPIIKNKIESFILNFISSNNHRLKLNQETVPSKIKSLLAFI